VDNLPAVVAAAIQVTLARLQQVWARVAAGVATGLLAGQVLPVVREALEVKQLPLMEKQLLGRPEIQLEFMEQYHERSATY
jgi:hypothetical protein